MHVRVASSFCNRCGGTSDVKVTFGSHSNLQWRLGGQLITNTSPETSEPFYVEAVSTREVRLVVFSARVGQLGMMLQCVSQSGATASMRLTLDGNQSSIITGSPSSLSFRTILHAGNDTAYTIKSGTTVHSPIHICRELNWYRSAVSSDKPV